MLKENQQLVVRGTIKFPAEADKKPRMVGNRCGSCGKIYFPKRTICPDCLRENILYEHELGTRGVIYSYTIVRYPSALPMETPYAYGYVDLIDDGIRIFSLFTGSDPGKLRIGMEVEFVIERFFTDRDGTEFVGYKFRPV